MKNTTIFSHPSSLLSLYYMILLLLYITLVCGITVIHKADASNKNDYQRVESLINKYSKRNIIRFILDSKLDITVEVKNNIFDTIRGRPNPDFITPKSILKDIELIGINIEDFTNKLAERFDEQPITPISSVNKSLQREKLETEQEKLETAREKLATEQQQILDLKYRLSVVLESAQKYKRMVDDYDSLNDYSNALSFYTQALEIQQKLGNEYTEDSLATIYKLIVLHKAIGNKSNSLPDYHQALQLQQQINDDPKEITQTINDIGSLYLKLGQYREAIHYFQQVKDSWQKYAPDTITQSFTLSNLGLAYVNLQQYTQALTYYEQALQLNPTLQQMELVPHLHAIALIYDYSWQYDKALTYYRKAISASRDKADKESEQKIRADLGKLEVALGSSAKALESPWAFPLLSATLNIIALLFAISLWNLFKKGEVWSSLLLLQLIAFGFIYWLIYAHLGTQHYRFDSPPQLFDWIQFTLVHVLRAGDYIDFIEEFQLDLQNVKHSSSLVANTVITMHWLVDIFLLAVVYQKFNFFETKYGDYLRRKYSFYSLIIMIIVWSLFILTLIFQSINLRYHISFGWLMWNTIILWPLDNLIRVIDVGDTFQLYDIRLYGIVGPQTFWLSALAVIFRFAASIPIAEIVEAIYYKLFGSFGHTTNEVIKRLGNSQFREKSKETLITFGSNAVPHLSKALLASKNNEIRVCIIEILEKIGSNASIVTPHLITCLADECIDIRKNVPNALDKIDPEWRRTLTTNKELARLLKTSVNESAEIIQAKIEALGAIANRRAVPLLHDLFNNQNKVIHRATIEALCTIADPISVEIAIAAFKESDSYMRKTATNMLIKIGSPSIKPLIAVYNNEDSEVRYRVVKILDAIGDSMALPKLHSIFIKDKNNKIRQAAIKAFCKIDAQRSQSLLITALNDNDTEICLIAAQTLNRIGWQPPKNEIGAYFYIILRDWNKCTDIGVAAVLPLIATFNDKDNNVVQAAMSQLIKIGTSVVPILIDKLQNVESRVLQAIVVTLGKIGDLRAVQPLISILQNRNENVRIAIVNTLGKLGDRQAVAPLITAFKDNLDSRIRRAIITALNAVGDVQALASIITIDKYDNLELSVRLAIITTLAKIGDPTIVEPLVIGLQDKEHYEVCKIAADALKKIGWQPPQNEIGAKYHMVMGDWQQSAVIGQQQNVMLLINRLKDTDDNAERQKIFNALTRTKDTMVLEQLVAALRHSNNTIVEAVTQVLISIGAPVIALLIKNLQYSDAKERETTVEILTEIGDPAVPQLIATLANEDIGIKTLAALVLGNIGDYHAIAPLRAELEKLKTEYIDFKKLVTVSMENLGNSSSNTESVLIELTKNIAFARETILNAIKKIRKYNELDV